MLVTIIISWLLTLEGIEIILYYRKLLRDGRTIHGGAGLTTVL
jgi:hypothetical protein